MKLIGLKMSLKEVLDRRQYVFEFQKSSRVTNRAARSNVSDMRVMMGPAARPGPWGSKKARTAQSVAPWGGSASLIASRGAVHQVYATPVKS